MSHNLSDVNNMNKNREKTRRSVEINEEYPHFSRQFTKMHQDSRSEEEKSQVE